MVMKDKTGSWTLLQESQNSAAGQGGSCAEMSLCFLVYRTPWRPARPGPREVVPVEAEPDLTLWEKAQRPVEQAKMRHAEGAAAAHGR